MSTGQELPIVELADQQAWRAWLEDNHNDIAGVWLKFAKKGAQTATVSYAEALEEASVVRRFRGEPAPGWPRRTDRRTS